MTTLMVHDHTPTGPLPLAHWPRRDQLVASAPTPHRRRADLIGVVDGLRAVTTFPEVDLTRAALRRTQPGQPVTVSALLARIGGGR